MKKPVHINCRRWFQKSFGNTYFSAYASFDDGSTETLIDFEYGYGNHCLDRALEVLAEKGFVTLPAPHANGCTSYNVTIFLREEMKCAYDVMDVQRKKDL